MPHLTLEYSSNLSTGEHIDLLCRKLAICLGSSGAGAFTPTIELGQRHERVRACLDRSRQRLDEVLVERERRAVAIAIHPSGV